MAVLDNLALPQPFRAGHGIQVDAAGITYDLRRQSLCHCATVPLCPIRRRRLWVSNNTKGSLLIVTLFHAAVNTAYVFLPVAPSVTGDVTRDLMLIGIEFVAAFAVVVIAGPARLSRRSPAQAGV